METPSVPTKLADLFAQFAQTLPKSAPAPEPAKFTYANPPSDEYIQAEFQKYFERAYEALAPVVQQLALSVLDEPDAVAADGSSAFGAQRVQGILAAITAHLGEAVRGYILAIDSAEDHELAVVAASAVTNIMFNIKATARKAILENLRRA